MNKMDVKVYDEYRKYGKLPGYEADPNRQCYQLHQNVAIFLVTPVQMNKAIRMEELDLIHNNRYSPLMILTDRRRVLAIGPEGYSYAKYVWSIDVETTQRILRMV